MKSESFQYFIGAYMYNVYIDTEREEEEILRTTTQFSITLLDLVSEVAIDLYGLWWSVMKTRRTRINNACSFLIHDYHKA
jgi:hypothetical protein